MAFWQIAAAGIVVVILASAAAFFVSRRISAPVSELVEGAKKMAAGDTTYRLEPPEFGECRALAEVMNQMASQLNSRISSLTEQRNELEAVLYGMSEAVLAIDSDERIIRVNKAAEKLFKIDASKIKGATLQEVIRNSQLQRFVRHTLLQNRITEGEIVFIGENEKFLNAHGSSLLDSNGSRVGALLVLNDITRTKKLEVIRRDFVANVSHELQTPITSIKGFLETLKEGAISDPENAQRFVDIAIKHTNRLIAIIEDLLSLSRIERDSEKGEILLEPVNISDVFSSVRRAFQDKAEYSRMTVTYDSDEALAALGNVTLLEQAIGNLVDNAIKYSPSDRAVRVEANRKGDNIVISVSDQGSGISREHLGRIFERFYRVDKSRSRKEGGTGLGLAIVKHIVAAHGGTVTVTSSPGAGSVFTIIIPSASESASV
jgi:two-component system phosphate regulon sensor histidine kinase PhoR